LPKVPPFAEARRSIFLTALERAVCAIPDGGEPEEGDNLALDCLDFADTVVDLVEASSPLPDKPLLENRPVSVFIARFRWVCELLPRKQGLSALGRQFCQDLEDVLFTLCPTTRVIMDTFSRKDPMVKMPRYSLSDPLPGVARDPSFPHYQLCFYVVEELFVLLWPLSFLADNDPEADPEGLGLGADKRAVRGRRAVPRARDAGGEIPDLPETPDQQYLLGGDPYPAEAYRGDGLFFVVNAHGTPDERRIEFTTTEKRKDSLGAVSEAESDQLLPPPGHRVSGQRPPRAERTAADSGAGNGVKDGAVDGAADEDTPGEA
jgi:hypothetical protein